jgi:gamma-glutamylcyclotransferase (GGCT)/AIG2-like uncharacterized protein YtfP
MFFYGTLKRGERNHDRYCSGTLRIEEATVRGQLYDLPLVGYPALVVPEKGSTLLAWAYVVEESSGVYLPGGIWPP